MRLMQFVISVVRFKNSKPGSEKKRRREIFPESSDESLRIGNQNTINLTEICQTTPCRNQKRSKQKIRFEPSKLRRWMEINIFGV